MQNRIGLSEKVDTSVSWGWDSVLTTVSSQRILWLAQECLQEILLFQWDDLWWYHDDGRKFYKILTLLTDFEDIIYCNTQIWFQFHEIKCIFSAAFKYFHLYLNLMYTVKLRYLKHWYLKYNGYAELSCLSQPLFFTLSISNTQISWRFKTNSFDFVLNIIRLYCSINIKLQIIKHTSA